MLAAFVFLTILLGFFGIILKQNLIMKIISMDIMRTGVIASYGAPVAIGPKTALKSLRTA